MLKNREFFFGKKFECEILSQNHAENKFFKKYLYTQESELKTL